MILEVSKGQQITLPASIRKKFGWTAGTKINLEITTNGVNISSVARTQTQRNQWTEADTYPCKLTPQQLKDFIHEEIY